MHEEEEGLSLSDCGKRYTMEKTGNFTNGDIICGSNFLAQPNAMNVLNRRSSVLFSFIFFQPMDKTTNEEIFS